MEFSESVPNCNLPFARNTSFSIDLWNGLAASSEVSKVLVKESSNSVGPQREEMLEMQARVLLVTVTSIFSHHSHQKINSL